MKKKACCETKPVLDAIQHGLDVHPGDTVVITCDQQLSPESRTSLIDTFRAKVGADIPILVLPCDVQVSVLHAEEKPAA